MSSQFPTAMSPAELQTAVETAPPNPSVDIHARSIHGPSPQEWLGIGSKDVELADLGGKSPAAAGNTAVVVAQSNPSPQPQPSASARRTARIQFMALCWSLFAIGWNDGTTGPLLTRIQSVYHVWSCSSIPLVFSSFERVDRSDLHSSLSSLCYNAL